MQDSSRYSRRHYHPTPVSQKTPIQTHTHRKRLCQKQKRAVTAQRQPASTTKDFPVDRPVAPAAETLSPRRWEQMNLCADPSGCNPPGYLLAGPAGFTPAGPSGDQRVSNRAVTNICNLEKSGRNKPQLPSGHRLHSQLPVQNGV